MHLHLQKSFRIRILNGFYLKIYFYNLLKIADSVFLRCLSAGLIFGIGSWLLPCDQPPYFNKEIKIGMQIYFGSRNNF